MIDIQENPEVLKVCCPDCGSDSCSYVNPREDNGVYFEPEVGERAFCEACGFEFVVAEKDLFSEREIGQMNFETQQG